MKIIKHHLLAKPLWSEWLKTTVPEPYMLVWFDDAPGPMLIGDCNPAGALTTKPDRYPECRVIAYARLDRKEIEALARRAL